jgi:uncharacterized membrane protein AbrB (regulator of aidB expression)
MLRSLYLISRVWSALSFIFIALVLIGVFFDKDPGGFNSTKEILLFSLFPVGVYAGMIVSWWKSPLFGGLISTICLIIFHIIETEIGLNIWLDGISAPGLLFLIYGLLKSKST